VTSRLDPRYYQIAVLGLLLAYGVLVLRFDVARERAALILGAALAAQFLCSLFWGLPHYEWRSALISGLSLCLLLRTNSWWIALVAAFATIASKFVLRWKGKHVFNPTNFGIVLMLILFPSQVWVSSGQWGSFAIAAFFMACLGFIVVHRSERSDVTIAFLFFWALILFGRSWMLGEPTAIPWHRLQNGAVLLFAFHMISDPKTTPDSRAGRIVFAFLVALGAWYVQFKMFRANGLLWSLAACHLLVPVIDKFLPGNRFEWMGRPQNGANTRFAPTRGDYEPAYP
jgi:Na+-transporting NADH:ubiquinone oxidoreductase subunit NqrB